MRDVMRTPGYEIVTVQGAYISLLGKNAKVEGDVLTVWVKDLETARTSSTSFNFSNGDICEWNSSSPEPKTCIAGLMNGFKTPHKNYLKDFACIAAGRPPTKREYPSHLNYSPAVQAFLQRYCAS
jgi:hypothetical protein